MSSDEQASRFEESKNTSRNWLNPIHMLILRDAVIARQQQVKLGDKWYKIIYASNDMIHVKNIKGFAPQGWFERREIIDYVDTLK